MKPKSHTTFWPSLKPGGGPGDGSIVTEVEALLRVDAGQPPENVLVFSERDVLAPRRRFSMVIAAVGLASCAAALSEPGRLELLLVPISCVVAALAAAPSREEQEEDGPRRPRVFVLCPEGFVLRDQFGVRRFSYDDLLFVTTGCVDGRIQLIVRDRGGESHLIDHLAYENGESLYDVIGQRLRQVQAARQAAALEAAAKGGREAGQATTAPRTRATTVA